MAGIPDISDPFKRYCAFLIERNAIWEKKNAGEPWPWTEDKILQSYRFTDIYRERDRTSLHYQKTVRNRYGEVSAVLPATVLYRWFNRIETCDALFNEPEFGNQSVFERYILGYKNLDVLTHCLNQIPTPHVTGAFIINGKPGYEKGRGVLEYFHQWCKKPWIETWLQWMVHPPTLQDMYLWLRQDGAGLGSFMAAQLVADLKYLPFMKDVSDWWSWAAPGPGSMRGLNVVLNHPMESPWHIEVWQEKIQVLNKAENIQLNPLGLGPFHAQDTQNHCCEFSKYTKVMLGIGRPRQIYHHA